MKHERDQKLLRTGEQNLTDLVRKDFMEKVTINYELKNESIYEAVLIYFIFHVLCSQNFTIHFTVFHNHISKHDNFFFTLVLLLLRLFFRIY